MYPGLREKFRRLEQLGWFIPGGLPVKYDLVGPKGRSYVKAAVLFVISRNHDGELQVLLTKRSHSVRTHKGETCLPGGHQDHSCEAPVETALREAQEEIQLDPSLVEVIAVLPPHPSGPKHLIAVTPVVCTLLGKPEDLSLVPNDEVEYTFWVPLRVFLQRESHTALKVWWRNVFLGVCSFEYMETLKDNVVPSPGDTGELSGAVSTRENEGHGYRNHIIWGLTASVCILVASIVLDRTPDFPCTVWAIREVDESKGNFWMDSIVLSPRQHFTYTSTAGQGLQDVSVKAKL